MLLVGLPLYIVAAVNVVSCSTGRPIWVELLIYVALGIIWTLPLRAVFRGVGREDPEAENRE